MGELEWGEPEIKIRGERLTGEVWLDRVRDGGLQSQTKRGQACREMGAGAEGLVGQRPEPWEREQGRGRGAETEIPREPLRRPTQRMGEGRGGKTDS